MHYVRFEKFRAYACTILRWLDLIWFAPRSVKEIQFSTYLS